MDPEDNFATEDSAKQAMELSLKWVNPTLKWACQIQNLSMLDKQEVDLMALGWEALKGL